MPVIVSVADLLYVGNPVTGDIYVFRINPSTGALAPVAGSPFASAPLPSAFAATANLPPSIQVDAGDNVVASLGNCAAGQAPVYRVFSNRADANHRYTTDRAVRDRMVGKGWLAEGDGADTVVMCAPGSVRRARGFVQTTEKANSRSPFFIAAAMIDGGVDGTRTRDPRRDRPVF